MNTQDQTSCALARFRAKVERGTVHLDNLNRFLNKVIAVGIVLIIVKFTFDL